MAAIIPAAGGGDRLGLGPKAFLEINGEELVARVVKTVAPCVKRVLVALPESYLDRTPAVVGRLAEVYPGRQTRHQTVLSLLERCREEFVLVHDISRPFASRQLFMRVIAAAVEHGAAVTFLKSQVPAARIVDGRVAEALRSTEIHQTQMPLAFRREILVKSYAWAAGKGIETQSTFELVFAAGFPVQPVEGEEFNVKVATALDWAVAQMVARQLPAPAHG